MRRTQLGGTDLEVSTLVYGSMDRSRAVRRDSRPSSIRRDVEEHLAQLRGDRRW